MKVCRICGEDKEDKYFYKLKGFDQYCHRKVVWCHTCMKAYMELKNKENEKKSLMKKVWLFSLSFQ